jgi:ABC-type transport system involved in cytochrome c biogenesis permease subunit
LAIHDIKNNFLFGMGMQAGLNHPESHSVHNIYLAQAYHTGFLGFVIFTTGIILTGASALILCIKRQYLSFLVLSLLYVSFLSGLTEFSQSVKSPSPMWFIVWLPISWVVALTIKEHRACLPESQKTTPSV